MFLLHFEAFGFVLARHHDNLALFNSITLFLRVPSLAPTQSESGDLSMGARVRAHTIAHRPARTAHAHCKSYQPLLVRGLLRMRGGKGMAADTREQW